VLAAVALALEAVREAAAAVALALEAVRESWRLWLGTGSGP